MVTPSGLGQLIDVLGPEEERDRALPVGEAAGWHMALPRVRDSRGHDARRRDVSAGAARARAATARAFGPTVCASQCRGIGNGKTTRPAPRSGLYPSGEEALPHAEALRRSAASPAVNPGSLTSTQRSHRRQLGLPRMPKNPPGPKERVPSPSGPATSGFSAPGSRGSPARRRALPDWSGSHRRRQHRPQRPWGGRPDRSTTSGMCR